MLHFLGHVQRTIPAYKPNCRGEKSDKPANLQRCVSNFANALEQEDPRNSTYSGTFPTAQARGIRKHILGSVLWINADQEVDNCGEIADNVHEHRDKQQAMEHLDLENCK